MADFVAKNMKIKDMSGQKFGRTIAVKYCRNNDRGDAIMGEPPTDKSQIDRINNNGNYCQSNCRWASSKTNNRNRRNNHSLIFDGKTMRISEWAERIGMYADTLERRIYLGWSIERSLTTPVGSRNK